MYRSRPKGLPIIDFYCSRTAQQQPEPDTGRRRRLSKTLQEESGNQRTFSGTKWVEQIAVIFKGIFYYSRSSFFYRTRHVLVSPIAAEIVTDVN